MTVLQPQLLDPALPNHLQQVEKNLKQMTKQRTLYSLISIAVVLFVVIAGVNVADSYNAGSFQRGIDNFFDYPIDLIVEAWEAGWVWPTLLVHHLPDLFNTINIAIFSTVVGAAFGFLFSVLSSKNLMKNEAVRQFFRRTMDLCRSFPELVIAMVFLYIMGKSLVPALIAITIHTSGALGKLFSEAIENIDKKPLEGLEAAGAGWWQQIRFGVITQALPLMVSYALLRLEINVRASTILGFVGAGGIGEALSTNIQWRYGDEVTAIMFLLVITIVSLDYLSAYGRAKLIGLGEK